MQARECMAQPVGRELPTLPERLLDNTPEDTRPEVVGIEEVPFLVRKDEILCSEEIRLDRL